MWVIAKNWHCVNCMTSVIFNGRFMFWQSAVCLGYPTGRSHFQKSTFALIPKTKKVEEGPSPMASKAATTQIAHVAGRRWDPKYSAWTRSHIAFKRPLGLCADCECRYMFALHWDEKSWEGHEAPETMHLQTQQSLGKWHAGVYQPCK